MLRDRRGWIWRGTDQDGILVSDGVHLNPEEWIHLTTVQGLPSDAVGPFGLFEDRDGSVWVSTARGVANIIPDPTWFQQHSARSVPRVNRMRWLGEENLWPSPGAVLPTGASTLEIDFAAWPDPLPRAPLFKHRLLPRDKEWRNSSDGLVRYDGLPSGAFRFEMQESGSSAIQAFEFRIGPAFPWSWWWLLGVVGAASSGWLVWKRRNQPQLEAEYWTAKREFLASKKDSADTDPEIAAVVGDRYAVRELIGKGGFARVYLAQEVGTGAMVAVKCLEGPQELLDWQRRRFEKEIEALRRIEHPGIVRLLDSGWISEREPYLVMDYIDGPTLREVLRSGPIERGRCIRWIRELGDALAEAHASGVLHRDLKPENILIASAGTAAERIVIVDFGAATVRNAAAGDRGSLMLGSFDYLAPEQVQGRSSPATDVYSFAAVVFEMLTGVRYASLGDGSPRGLQRALVGFPTAAVAALAEGLAFVPEERPQDIRTFAHSLVDGLGG